MLAMQTRNRVENIERMHEQLLLSEKAFKGKPNRLKSKSLAPVACWLIVPVFAMAGKSDRVEGQVEEAPAESAGDETAKDSDEKTKVETTSSDAEDVKEASLPRG